MIEGLYLVKKDSPLRSNDEVDRESHRVVVGKGSAYDLYLTRTRKNARILRSSTSPIVVETFVKEGAEVAAGVKQQLEADARQVGGLRLLNERFMVIQHAMGVLRAGAVKQRIPKPVRQRVKSSGFVNAALERHCIHGASVAPAVKK